MQAHLAESGPGYAIFTATDASGTVWAEFLVFERADEWWQLQRFGVGLPEAVCDALESRL